ncbi:MAG: family 16 glycoside hydrolase [Thermoanaerobaculia bacterium]
MFALFSMLLLAATHKYAWNSLDGLEPHNVQAEVVTYHGRRAVHLVEPGEPYRGSAMAIVTGSDFQDGVIEVDIAGAPRKDAPEGSRGFVGIAFRVQPDNEHYECFYLRPTNGRADDQLRRNHSVQYVSEPEWPWERLRKEMPGVYESYADLVSGEWTRVRIVVSGTHAQFYVNGAEQPCLIVNDLKAGTSRGRIALWIGDGTDAHFANLVVK